MTAVDLPAICTVGHSTRGLDEFVALLHAARVQRIVDIRTVPRSRANPQFNLETLPEALAASNIDYEHVAALGGLRGSSGVPPDVNAFWTNESFHHYADYALSPAFRAGLKDLLAACTTTRCAIMCAEAVWWRCHRRIVADYLIAASRTVFHIMGAGRLEPARLTPGALVQPDGTVVYPAAGVSRK